VVCRRKGKLLSAAAAAERREVLAIVDMEAGFSIGEGKDVKYLSLL
jgi:hypothetical protein